MGQRLFYGTLTVAPPGEALLAGATFIEEARTASRYRLYSLDGFPVLVEDPDRGRSLGVQVWEVPETVWTEIVAAEPPEMAPGAVELDDGRTVETLLGTAEFVSTRGGVDVSEHGSWATYRASA